MIKLNTYYLFPSHNDNNDWSENSLHIINETVSEDLGDENVASSLESEEVIEEENSEEAIDEENSEEVIEEEKPKKSNRRGRNIIPEWMKQLTVEKS